MTARLKDVAELAGVSLKTASNVINDYPHITPATRARVEAAIAELRYQPNISARQLKYGRAGFLALAVPRMNEPYFAELASRFTQAAARLGYIMLLDTTQADIEAERLVLDGIRTHVIDGVIFSPLKVSTAEIRGRGEGVPMVLLGERAVADRFDHVAVDSVAAARAMTVHLIGQGRRRVGAIGQQSREGTGLVRLDGYRQALAENKLPYDPTLVVPVSGYGRSDGRAAMHTLLRLPEPPNAVFCFNDLLAIGALRACVEAGVEVPSQVAVAGFDNIEEGRFSNPTLSTISSDLDVLTSEALRLLLSRVKGVESPPTSVSVPWTLHARESTQC